MAGESNEAPKLKLYSRWRSSCSHRVRIALNLKGLDYEYKVGDSTDPELENINPMKFVPALVDGDVIVADSFPIILYLDEKYPEYPLLPKDLQKKALNLQDFLRNRFDSDDKLVWAQLVVDKGFTAIEKLLSKCSGKYAIGDEIQMADLFLEPQIYSSLTRFQIDMTKYPILTRLHEEYMKIHAFQAAMPEKQPDGPSVV